MVYRDTFKLDTGRNGKYGRTWQLILITFLPLFETNNFLKDLRNFIKNIGYLISEKKLSGLLKK